MLQEKAAVPRDNDFQRRIDLLHDKPNAASTSETRDAEIQLRLQKLKLSLHPNVKSTLPSSSGIMHGRTCETTASENPSSPVPQKKGLATPPTEATGLFHNMSGAYPPI